MTKIIMGLLILLGFIMFVFLFFIVFFTIALLAFSRKDGKEENLVGIG
jgi:hypothetical protein